MTTGGLTTAMVLAAGRGERMRPLTDRLAKPMLEVGGRALIEWHLLRLAAVGVQRVVVNTDWCAEALQARVHERAPQELEVVCLREPPGALDTGGGVHNALPWLGRAPFLLLNGDVWTDLPLEALPACPDADAHLVLVPNPPHNADGDFELDGSGRVGVQGAPRGTYAGIAVLRPALFDGCTAGVFPLAPLLHAAAGRGRVSGQWHRGRWSDVGTPERLRAARRAWARREPHDGA